MRRPEQEPVEELMCPSRQTLVLGSAASLSRPVPGRSWLWSPG